MLLWWLYSHKNAKIRFSIKIFCKLSTWLFNYVEMKTRRTHKTDAILMEKATFNELECKWKIYLNGLEKKKKRSISINYT